MIYFEYFPRHSFLNSAIHGSPISKNVWYKNKETGAVEQGVCVGFRVFDANRVLLEIRDNKTGVTSYVLIPEKGPERNPPIIEFKNSLEPTTYYGMTVYPVPILRREEKFW